MKTEALPAQPSRFSQHRAAKLKSGSSHHNHNLTPREPLTSSLQSSILEDDSFRKTASLLYQTNFEHHHEDCLCNDCDCGRHRCKMNIIKPNITKQTVYGQSFAPKSALKFDNTVLRPHSSDHHDMPHLGMRSTYGGSFRLPKGDSLQRPKPKDELGVGGPSQGLTSYSNGFPGHFGENQYVKKEPDAFRGGLPFQGKTTYGKEFVNPNSPPEGLLKTPDSMGLGKPWFGNSTYRDLYRHPNPEAYPAHVHPLDKLETNPNYSHQYETTYKNDFLKTKTAVCPAKIILQTGRAGSMAQTKGKFQENSDFKAMSPEFQAFSRSRHVFV